MQAYTSIDELIGALPALAAPLRSALAGRDNLFALHIKGRKCIFIRLQGGLVQVEEASAEKPVCTVSAAEKDLLDMMAGRLSPARALLTRRVQAKGNPAPLMELLSLLNN